MNTIETMLELLGQKQRCFEEYEEVTHQMLSCPVEEMEVYLESRQGLIEKIDSLSGALFDLADSLEDPASAKAALRLSCGRDELPPSLCPLFDQSQQICAVVSRVSRCEPQLADRIEEELEALTEKIRDNNRSVSAKAAKYQVAFGAAGPGQGGRQIGKA